MPKMELRMHPLLQKETAQLQRKQLRLQRVPMQVLMLAVMPQLPTMELAAKLPRQLRVLKTQLVVMEPPIPLPLRERVKKNKLTKQRLSKQRNSKK